VTEFDRVGMLVCLVAELVTRHMQNRRLCCVSWLATPQVRFTWRRTRSVSRIFSGKLLVWATLHRFPARGRQLGRAFSSQAVLSTRACRNAWDITHQPSLILRMP
jgi:hypothetical protein